MFRVLIFHASGHPDEIGNIAIPCRGRNIVGYALRKIFLYMVRSSSSAVLVYIVNCQRVGSCIGSSVCGIVEGNGVTLGLNGNHNLRSNRCIAADANGRFGYFCTQSQASRNRLGIGQFLIGTLLPIVHCVGKRVRHGLLLSQVEDPDNILACSQANRFLLVL